MHCRKKMFRADGNYAVFTQCFNQNMSREDMLEETHQNIIIYYT